MPTYWLSYVLVMPLAGFIFNAMILIGIGGLLGHKPTPPELLTGWAIATVLITLFALNIDRRKPHFELTDSTLRIGRGAYATVIPLEEIESAVFGLPEHTPWWFRILRFAPQSRGTHHFISMSRACSLFIRFGSRRYVPLCLYYTWMLNGRELMEALRERLQEKMVGAESYTPAEVAALKLAKFNRVGMLRGGDSSLAISTSDEGRRPSAFIAEATKAGAATESRGPRLAQLTSLPRHHPQRRRGRRRLRGVLLR